MLSPTVASGREHHSALAIQVAMTALPSAKELETLWLDLQARADTAFFVTWEWVSAWLLGLPATVRPGLLMAKDVDGRVVGLGILVPGRVRLLKRLDLGCWHLNAAGEAQMDGGLTEYNGFVVDASMAPAVRRAMVAFMTSAARPGRLRIHHADDGYQELIETPPPHVLARAERARSYLVSLDRVRASAGGYMALLSANSRSQVRRSVKAYETLGPLAVQAPGDLAEAREYLRRLRELHTATWQQRQAHSHFASEPVAQRFHDRLLERTFATGNVQLLRIAAGDVEIGYLYNFVYRGRVYFYQSGLGQDLVPKHDRPGLVCHALAVQFNAGLGHAWYDFMAGDYRYKASLSTHCKYQWHCLFQRESWLDALDTSLRRWYVRRQPPAEPAVPAEDLAHLEVAHGF